MKKIHVLPEGAGQASFRKTSGLARQGLKDAHCLAINDLEGHHDQYSISCPASALPPTSLLPCTATVPGHSIPSTDLEASYLRIQVTGEASPIKIMDRVFSKLDPNSSRRAPAKHQSPLNRGLPLTRT